METITILQWAIDTLLGIGLLWLAWLSLASPSLFKAIVLFITFGLLMALTWIRLDAPDVAMAEAAIGAGLTGALLMTAMARLQKIDRVSPNDDDANIRSHSGLIDDIQTVERKND